MHSLLKKCTGFEWDMHNAGKIWQKHGVSPTECEQIYFNRPLVFADDLKHSEEENRFYALGKTDGRRLLFVVFTVRQDKIRVISARDMNRKERKAYYESDE
ncbi:MAG: BrnT family toxin [Nitrospirae bacterium]|nr:BrnT family toxin [Nitrospirota bacterium]